MITISRPLMRRLRIVFSRGFGITKRNPGPPVTIEANHKGVAFRAGNSDFAIQYFHASEQESVTFAAPFDLLRRVEGSKANENVELQYDATAIFAEWFDGSMPMTAELDAAENDFDFPPLPDNFVVNPPSLLDALRDAAETSTQDSARYALNHLRLRGSDGQIAATDGRQILVQSGFAFPWEGERLVPTNRLFKSCDLSGEQPLEVGSTIDFVVIRSGPWTVWLCVEAKARFPDVDSFLRSPESSMATMHIDEPDANFLAHAVTRLPCGDEYNKPVTCDLNGAIAVRASGTADQKAAEIVLNNSRREGDPIRFSTNRNYLGRALQLGFRTLNVFGVDAPVRCHQPKRDYIWALLGKDGVVKAEAGATRIESPVSPTVKPPKQEKPNLMIKSNEHRSTADDDQQSASELIETAESLKTSLRESLANTTALISGLKRHRQQTKKIRSAVATLKQLRAIDA